jgi:hypothetical protein
LNLIENQNGNHVLQKCCEVLNPKALIKIADKIVANVFLMINIVKNTCFSCIWL